MTNENLAACERPADLSGQLLEFDKTYIAAFDSGNATALAELFTEDAIVMNTFGSLVRGRAAIIGALERAFSSVCHQASLRINPLHCHPLGNEVVVQVGTTRTTMNTTPETYRDFTYSRVFVREAGGWKLAAVHFGNLEAARP
jgi:uncharacterized protein (TIGR02246 family)